MAVHEDYGFPMGHKKIYRKRMSNYNDALSVQWKSYSRNSLKPNDVADRMKNSTTVDRMFQVDFMVLMVTTLISATSRNRINRAFLTSFSNDFLSKDCKEFNWWEYVMSSLEKSMQAWDPKDCNSYFIGPLTFLMLLYCDPFCVMLDPPIQRKRPVIAQWECNDLKRRREAEFNNGGHGSGELLEWKAPEEKDAHVEDCGCAVEQNDEAVADVKVDSPFCGTSQGVVSGLRKQLEVSDGIHLGEHEEGYSSSHQREVADATYQRGVVRQCWSPDRLLKQTEDDVTEKFDFTKAVERTPVVSKDNASIIQELQQLSLTPMGDLDWKMHQSEVEDEASA